MKQQDYFDNRTQKDNDDALLNSIKNDPEWARREINNLRDLLHKEQLKNG